LADFEFEFEHPAINGNTYRCAFFMLPCLYSMTRVMQLTVISESAFFMLPCDNAYMFVLYLNFY